MSSVFAENTTEWTVYVVTDTISTSTQDYQATVVNNGNYPITLDITTQKLGKFKPINDSITVPASSEYIVEFTHENDIFSNYFGNITFTEQGSGAERILPLSIKGTESTELFAQLSSFETLSKELNAPIFGWIAPKKIAGSSIFLPVWLFALVLTSIVTRIDSKRNNNKTLLGFGLRLTIFILVFIILLLFAINFLT